MATKYFFCIFALLVQFGLIATNKVFKVGDVQVEIIREAKSCDFATEKGDTLRIHYTGKFTNGDLFDSSYDRKMPLHFVLGESKLIEGWHLGMNEMCIGEKRRLTIPPHLAYGDKGSGKVPGGATLVFEAELVDILYD